MYISKTALYINKTALVTFIFGCQILGQQKCRPQLCTGSLGDPVVNINFGSGTATHAGVLASRPLF
jgi:hypothetical protein